MLEKQSIDLERIQKWQQMFAEAAEVKEGSTEMLVWQSQNNGAGTATLTKRDFLNTVGEIIAVACLGNKELPIEDIPLAKITELTGTPKETLLSVGKLLVQTGWLKSQVIFDAQKTRIEREHARSVQ